MLTKYGYYKTLDNIFKTGGLSESMEKDMLKLKADFDEREGMLKKYGETYDGKDKDEYEYREYENQGNAEMWENKYNALEKRFREAFWNAGSRQQGDSSSMVDTPEPNAEDNTPFIDRILY